MPYLLKTALFYFNYMTLQNLISKSSLLVIFLFILFLGCACSKNELNPEKEEDETASDEDTPPEDEDDSGRVIINLNPAQTYQTIDNFGASDAWSIQFVGNWAEDKKSAIADLLFSTDMDNNGNPKGIGLSLWRFNMGAGSAQQGAQSGIGDEWRRAESFLDADGTYNWNRQAGQQWFLSAAKERGVEQLLAFSNSPPVQFTKNGKAYAYNGQSNLAPEQYNNFAEYISKVIKGLGDKGIEIDYISPVNEPQWDWSDGGQEGTPFMNQEIAGIVRALNSSLENNGLDTKIDLAEAAKINYLYASEDKPGRGNQTYAFFKPNSTHYVGDLSRVSNAISGHSYFTTSPFSEAVKTRKLLADEIAQVSGLKFWMSEYCILGDNAGEIEGNSRNLGIEPALYIARVIHNDLVISNASAWHWWLAVSPYNYKDGLVYIDHTKMNGNFYESKMLWALGNYSRFIRPGAVRIDVQSADLDENKSSLLVSAYTHPSDNQLVSVIVNSGKEAVDIKMDYGDVQLENIRLYNTSKDDNLRLTNGISDGNSFTVAPGTITTLVGDIK